MNSMENEKPNNSKLAWIALIICCFVGSFWLWAYYSLKDETELDRGTFGDMFGAVNSLFSGLAFAGIILTILLQREELALQREELKNTREELKRAADAQENSNKELKRQAENLKISAKLTGLNSLVAFYLEEENQLKKRFEESHNQISIIKQKRRRFIGEIERIVDEKIID